NLASEQVTSDLTAYNIAPNSFQIYVGGKLKLSNSFTIYGSFLLHNDANALSVAINSKIHFFSVHLKVNANASIVKRNNPRFALNAFATIDGNLFDRNFIDIKAGFQFQVNPLHVGTVLDVYDSNVPRETYKIAVNNAQVTILKGLKLYGNAY